MNGVGLTTLVVSIGLPVVSIGLPVVSIGLSVGSFDLLFGSIGPTGFNVLVWGSIGLVTIAFAYIIWALVLENRDRLRP